MNKNKFHDYFYLGIIVAIALLLLFDAIDLAFGQSGSEIAGWEFDFYQLRPLQGDYTTISAGDTIKIDWIQELKTIPYNQQYDWGIGDTTGVKKTFYVSINEITKVLSNDSTYYSCKAARSIALIPGSWALVMRTKGAWGKWSKHSKPYWFNVVGYPPQMPIEIKLIVK